MKTERSQLIRKLSLGLTIALACIITLFFRTYPLRATSEASQNKIRAFAEDSVRQGMKSQVEAQAEVLFPDAGKEERQKIVEERLAEVIRGGGESFNKAVDVLERELMDAQAARYSGKYLVGADSYYFYSLSENILEQGSLGEGSGGGTFKNPRRLHPYVNRDRINLHPYSGVFLYSVMKLFNPHATLMQACSIIPLILSLLTVLCFFYLARQVSSGVAAAWVGAMVLSLASIVIQRSTFGWYDSDPYNVLFPVIVLSLLMKHLRGTAHPGKTGFVTGLLTSFYSLFWYGWIFLFFLVSAVSFMWWFVDMFRTKSLKGGQSGPFLGMFLAASFLGVLVFMTPAGFLWSLKNGILYFVLSRGGGSGESAVWPNLLILIQETAGLSPKDWITDTGNMSVFVTALAGGVAGAVYAVRKKDRVFFRQWFVTLLLLTILFLFSLSAERFALLAVTPLALMMVLAVEGLQRVLSTLWERAPVLGKIPSLQIKRSLIGLFFALIFLPGLLRSAQISASATPIIMNDYWHDALTELKEKSPEDAVVYSWWPPGFFIQALARRATPIDGGTQRRGAQHYWISKAFMTSDEALSVGIFRMLQASGNDASLWLIKKGFRIEEAARIIENIVRLNRAQADDFLKSDFSPEQRQALLDLTHGQGKPVPSYLLIYEELIEKNVIMQVVSEWNFNKAAELKRGRKTQGLKGLIENYFTKKQVKEYGAEMINVADEILSYTEEIRPEKQEGDTLFFEGGLVVNIKTGQAAVATAAPGGPRFVPLTLHMYRNGKWSTTVGAEEIRPYILYLVVDREGYKLSMAHKKLADSMLYQLFFFNGRNGKYFHPVSLKGDFGRQHFIQVYRIDFPED